MAVQITREVTVDVVKRGSTRAIYAKQNDVNSRFLKVRIQEDGRDIQIVSTSTVLLNVERPDKAEDSFYGSVNEDGTVKVPLTSWMLELEGTLLCDVSIIDEDPDVAKLTTMQFSIYVEAAVRSDDTIDDTEEYSITIDLLKRTEDSAKVAEAAAKSASEAAANAEYLQKTCGESAEELEKIKAELAEGGFITGIKEKNKGRILSFWVGSTEEYNSLPEIPQNCYVILTDDKTLEEVRNEIALVTAGVQGITQEFNNMHKNGPYELNRVLYEDPNPTAIGNRTMNVPSLSNYDVIKVVDVNDCCVLMVRQGRYLFEGSCIGRSAWTDLDTGRETDAFILRTYRLQCDYNNPEIVYYKDMEEQINSSVAQYSTVTGDASGEWQLSWAGWFIKKIIGVI